METAVSQSDLPSPGRRDGPEEKGKESLCGGSGGD